MSSLKHPFLNPPSKCTQIPPLKKTPPPPTAPQDFQFKHSLKCYEFFKYNKYLQGFVVPTRVYSWQRQQENPKTKEIPIHITGNS